MKLHLHLSTLLLLTLPFSLAAADDQPAEGKKNAKAISLIKGDKLDGWQKTQFGGPGEVSVKEGVLTIEMGSPLNGVTITEEAFKKLPKVNYEMRLEAKRELGGDFFVGLTFPVKDQHCSLIMGGWGGGVIGISSIDGYDASENESTTYATFENGKWYNIRLQVTDNRITVWLDDEEMVDVDIEERRLDTRIEVDLSKPLGLSSFETTAKIRDFKIRPLSEK
ncbi:3-keto-disaccharide hydrolase [Rubinisphaera margarita]|uniref:3-keto-disaccharide hydrolase n=1 Tax=Rubinisphaera margarita TaxID=2909586 RepID=UPI001EE8083B|nr:DUF1080 domain-containing protein [Rubinisphaera margarita]MCG6156892.1 DUF1080 domain-containing protein [Rubinisphaera margarita]